MKASTLDSLMAPVTDCLDRESLEALLPLRADAKAQARMGALAERANEGTLTEEERSEYESCVMFANFLGVLQAKARHKLQAGRP